MKRKNEGEVNKKEKRNTIEIIGDVDYTNDEDYQQFVRKYSKFKSEEIIKKAEDVSLETKKKTKTILVHQLSSFFYFLNKLSPEVKLHIISFYKISIPFSN